MAEARERCALVVLRRQSVAGALAGFVDRRLPDLICRVHVTSRGGCVQRELCLMNGFESRLTGCYFGQMRNKPTSHGLPPGIAPYGRFATRSKFATLPPAHMLIGSWRGRYFSLRA